MFEKAADFSRGFFINRAYPSVFLDKLRELRQKKGFFAKGIAFRGRFSASC